jgi:hypothetical protein
MKKITMDELLKQFDESVHDRLRALAEKPGTSHLVVFENQMLDSSQAGARSALRIGPACTTKTLDEAAGGWLGDLPSERKYPVAFVELSATP